MQNVLKKPSAVSKPAVNPNILQEKYIRAAQPQISSPAPIAHQSKKTVTPNNSHLPPFLEMYRQHFFTLFLAIVFYSIAGYILMKIGPTTIQNVIVPNMYLPLLLAAGVGHFFFFSFLFLKSRRGAVIALFLTLILFLRLQQVLTFSIAALCFLPFLLFESTLTFIERKR